MHFKNGGKFNFFICRTKGSSDEFKSIVRNWSWKAPSHIQQWLQFSITQSRNRFQEYSSQHSHQFVKSVSFDILATIYGFSPRIFVQQNTHTTSISVDWLLLKLHYSAFEKSSAGWSLPGATCQRTPQRFFFSLEEANKKNTFPFFPR